MSFRSLTPIVLTGFVSLAICVASSPSVMSEEKNCAADADKELSLPAGFCATIFADKVGHARQLAVASDGTVYVNTWSGVYYGNDTPPAGGFLIALKDTKGTGHADTNVRFGPTVAEGAHGGTGIWLYKNWLYAEIDDKIVRYELKEGRRCADSKPETIFSGMPLNGDHPMHPFAIDAQGNLLVSMGATTNACEVQNRMPHSPGNDPCTELETRAGIWRYDANKPDQVFSPKERYATGIRNGEGFDFDTAGRLYVTEHGRDQLHEDWPELYTAEQGSELPAERVLMLKEGGDYGWPTCYFDPAQKKLVLAPEYGGDGGKKIGDCDKVRAARRDVSSALGAKRSQDLQGLAVSEGIPRRRLHRLPRLVEPRAGATRRLQCASSSRWPTASRQVTTSSSPTVSPARSRIRDGQRIAPRAWQSGRTARFTSPMTRPVESGA